MVAVVNFFKGNSFPRSGRTLEYGQSIIKKGTNDFTSANFNAKVGNGTTVTATETQLTINCVGSDQGYWQYTTETVQEVGKFYAWGGRFTNLVGSTSQQFITVLDGVTSGPAGRTITSDGRWCVIFEGDGGTNRLSIGVGTNGVIGAGEAVSVDVTEIFFQEVSALDAAPEDWIPDQGLACYRLTQANTVASGGGLISEQTGPSLSDGGNQVMFACAGDSWSDCWPVGSQTTLYLEWPCWTEGSNNPGYVFAVNAKSSRTLETMLAQAPDLFSLDGIPTSIQRVQNSVVLGGMNDLTQLAQAGDTQQEMFDKITGYMTSWSNLSPGVAFICTIPPSNRGATSDAELARLQINTWVNQQTRFVPCDIATAIASPDGRSIATEYVEDDQHPNEAGSEVIASLILSKINERFTMPEYVGVPLTGGDARDDAAWAMTSADGQTSALLDDQTQVITGESTSPAIARGAYAKDVPAGNVFNSVTVRYDTDVLASTVTLGMYPSDANANATGNSPVAESVALDVDLEQTNTGYQNKTFALTPFSVTPGLYVAGCTSGTSVAAPNLCDTRTVGNAEKGSRSDTDGVSPNLSDPFTEAATPGRSYVIAFSYEVGETSNPPKDPLVTDSAFTLGGGGGKKDVAQDTGAPAPGDAEMAIYLNDAALYARQSIVGTFDVLKRYVLNNLNTLQGGGTEYFRVPVGGSLASVSVAGVVGTGEIALYVGADFLDKAQSGFIDETYRQLIAAFLEASTGN